ncbi:uncharacterized protein LOC128955668 [Oppia nitens]|uniref:uncharacterized protein LOC128955668 n=1 Tax=Oppia nitens TaxID=1686743 RepID=UPI0023DA7A71|nr:uncharacterized protein LOC128955668 [Oppia nitens]
MSKDINDNPVNGSNKVIKNIEDITSMDDLDLDKIDLVRGETPIDINDQCLQLCKDYLSGEWIQQTVDTITVTRITGGLTNQIYYCGINEPNPTSKVPQEVAVKLYGKKFIKNSSDNYERLPDVIIDLMISENQLGPKVYAIFEHGQIIKYYKHRQFKPEEQSNTKLVDEVFRKLAQIHAMNVPIKRSHNRFDEIDESYKIAFEGNIDIKKIFETHKCETLLTADIKSEIQFIRGLIEKVNIPIVFTHNDYRSSNILITESVDKTDGPLVICDFEFVSYSYRGLDFMPLLREWGRKQFDMSNDGLPHDDSVLRPLIEIYLNECEKIYGKEFTANKLNSMDHMLYELKLSYLIYQLFVTLVLIKYDLKNQTLANNIRFVNINANPVNGSNKVVKNIENITSMDDLDLDNIDLVRGETPIDINDQCLQLCKNYLSGEWIQQTVDTITVTRITGGLTNQIYYCGINEPNPTSKVPQEVAVRLYGKKSIKNGDNYERLPDVIIDLMISESQLGPKHRQFKPEEQRNTKLVDEVFRKLAQIHAMNVPIKRSHNRFDEILDESYKIAFEGNIDIKKIFETHKCETLLTADIKSEIQFIRSLIEKANIPIVFTHNDYRSSNILITESVDKTDGPLVICDFECASYSYRGLDFMPLLREWGRKQFDKSNDGLPHDDSVLRPLIEIYLNECEKIYGKEFIENKLNSMDHMLYELKLKMFYKDYLVLKQRYKEMNLI